MVSNNFPNRPFRLQESTWLIQQDVANNRSLIGTELWIFKNSHSPTVSGDTSSYNFVINGVSVASGNFTYNFVNSDSLRLAGVQTWVPHNADGTKSFAVDGYCNADLLGYTEVHSTVWLPTIARASTASLPGGTTFDAGSTVQINTNRASASFTHKVEWGFGTRRELIADGVATTVNWTPDLSLLEQIPNSTSGNGSIYLTTYSGATKIGNTTSTTFYLTPGPGVIPAVAVPTVVDQNTTVRNNIGAFVQDLSVARVSSTATGVYGSTITSLGVSVDGSEPAASGSDFLLSTSGSIQAKATATDSRARVNSATRTLAVLPYNPPAASAFSAERASSNGTPSPTGTYLRFDLTAAISGLTVGGTQKNSMTITVRTRPTGGSWTTRNSITSTLTYNNGARILGGSAYPISSSFDVQVTIRDRAGQTYVAQTTVPTGTVALDVNGVKLGVGKYHQQGALDVGGQIYQSNNPVIDSSKLATATAAGIVELATPTEATGGTDSTRAVTPAGLAGMRVRVASASATSGNQGGITTTLTEVTGSSVAFTLDAPSLVIFSAWLTTYSGSASDVILITVRDDTTNIENGTVPANSSPTISATGRHQEFTGEVRLAAGAHRLNIAVSRVVGTGSVTIQKSATAPVRLTVDRII